MVLSEFDKGWLIGIIEGEGCFSIQQFTQLNKKNTTKIRFTPLFKISLCANDKELIYKIQKLIGFGNINFKPKKYWTKLGMPSAQDQYNFKLENVEDCKKFTNLFDEDLFKSSKKQNFILWKEGLELIYTYKHLEREGMIRLAEIRDLMNKKIKSKNYKNKEYILNLINQRNDLFTPKEMSRRLIMSKKKRNCEKIAKHITI